MAVKSALMTLSTEQFDKLAKSLPSPYVGKDTTELQAGMMIGVTMVLNKLKEGFVVES